MKQFSLFFHIALIGVSFLSTSTARANDSLEQAFKDGTPYLDMRYRYEFADQNGLSEDAHASTLRTRVGYKSGSFHDFSGVIELENILQIGSDNYNDTKNGRTNHPVVADVENTEINQAFLQFTGIPDTQLRAGRERINLDNQRFIGSVGWRQNDQTFDGITIVNRSLPETAVTYGYIYNVNRIFGDESDVGDFESDSHIIHAANQSTALGTIKGYVYLLDFERDAPGASSQTFGISLNGSQPLDEDITFKYHAEYAHQEDYGDNPVNYDADYLHLAPAIAWKGLTTTIGYELLGSDNGMIGFSTPLATLHKFNGFADVFLNTPAAGLEDIYVDISYKVNDVKGPLDVLNGLFIKGQYHDFSSDQGSVDYGDEFGLYLKKPFGNHYYAELKYADYNADNFATDRQRVILGLGVTY